MKRLQTLWFDEVAKRNINPRERSRNEQCPTIGQETQEVPSLGEVNVISREEYADLDLDSKVEAIRALVPLGLMHVGELVPTNNLVRRLDSYR